MSTGSSTQSPAAPVNTYLRWFRILVILGLLGNLGFVVQAFFTPEAFMKTMNLPVAYANIWLRTAGSLVIMISVFYIPAILEPARYPVYSWWVALMRPVGALFWVFGIILVPGASPMILISDALIGAAQIFCLQRGLPAADRLSPALLRNGFPYLVAPGVKPNPHYLNWFRLTGWLGFLLNLAFVVQALFLPAYLAKSAGAPPESVNVWLRNCGTLVLTVSLFYIPALRAPSRYPLYTWCVPGLRFAGALFWFYAMDLYPGLQMNFWTDLGLGILQSWLLYRGARGGPIAAV